MFNILRDCLDALVHPSARYDALLRIRHRAFMAPRLIVCLAALAAFPVYLAVNGAPEKLDAAAFAFVILPILTCYYLSRSGRLDRAQMMSSVILAGITGAMSVAYGGIATFSAIWLIVIPLEAALAGSKRVLIASTLVAAATALALGIADAFGLFAANTMMSSSVIITVSMVAAIVYAGGIAFGAAQIWQESAAQLAAETQRYRALAANMTDIVTHHRRNGDVLFMAPGAEAVLGIAQSALAGHGLFERVHVADRPAYLTALSMAAAGSEQHVEFRLRRDASRANMVQFVWIEMVCRAASIDAEGEVAVTSVMRDISERKLNEELLARATQDAARADAAKSEFLATVSHELRTPLNAIIGFSDMILQENELHLDAARRQEYAQLINQSGHHLLSIVNGILDMSKIDAGTFQINAELFEPRASLINCCNLLALKALERNIEIVTRAPLELPQMNADPRAFKQIMLNLISNAVKFSNADSTVIVSAEQDHRNLIIKVRDTGVGIDADDLKRIGDPFFQASKNYNRQYEGTGLGLSIVKNLVAMHGGEMTVESRIEEGTTITVSLPLEFASQVDNASNVATFVPASRVAPPESICQVRKIA